MAGLENKENVTPPLSSESLVRRRHSPEHPTDNGGGSPKTGQDNTNKSESVVQYTKTRRDNSVVVLGGQSTISPDTEKARRQAARRRILANRRVSFAPEVTLYKWNVFECSSDETTSPDASPQTRQLGNVSTPFGQLDLLHREHTDLPSSPPEDEVDSNKVPPLPGPRNHSFKRQRHRSFDIPLTNCNNLYIECFGSTANGGTTSRRRRRSVTSVRSHGAETLVRSKRSRRSLVPTSFTDKETLDLTMAMGGNRDAALLARRECRESAAEHQSSGTVRI
ncbi:hypothetical protein LTR22_026129 [Elasticomyces elasticus]|nr:hypothetical protein LTR22_026129 [Elasticomyces elasticus]